MKKESNNKISRRELLGSAATVATFTIVPRHVLAGSGQTSPSDRLNIAGIGCGGQGGGDLRSAANGNNVVALCDVDEVQAGSTFSQYYPDAKLYKDFRQMLDREQNNIDAVTIGIPDHMHASAAVWAMERGMGVYVEKPLTQTIWEARLLKKAAQKYQVATQMGNQGYSAVATRVATEFIWNGDLGDVTEVHSMSRGGFARGVTEWPAAEPVPDTLNWDLWTGRAPMHPYSSTIHPENWRGYLDYGTMMIGDWGIHMLGPANWALGLSYTHPISVTCTAVEGANTVTYPNYSCVTEFPQRPHPYHEGQTMSPVKVYWYEGSMAGNFTPPEPLTQEDVRSYNEVFIGTKAYIGTGGRGESVGVIRQSITERPPELIERSPGHMQDWILACKGERPACSNFEISAAYTEWMLLGAISWRFPEEKLEWDGENLRFTNNDKANEYVRPYFREGWELEDITV